MKYKKKINHDDLFIKDDDYGIQKHSHVTIAPSLEQNLKVEMLKPYLKDLSQYEAVITGISIFDCEEFDVLKCDIESDSITQTNSEIFKHYQCCSTIKTFSPHLTIAFLKKGQALKYIPNNFTEKIKLMPKEFMFSWLDKEEKRQTLYFTK